MPSQKTSRRADRVPIVTALVGLAVSLAFLATSDLTLPQFAWSFWLVGLVSVCIATVRFAVLLVLRRDSIVSGIPQLQSLSRGALLAASVVLAAAAVPALLYIFLWVYSFYGLFLSVFAQMEPLALFGPNGFINADLNDVVRYLVAAYWPLVVGQVISESARLLRAPGPSEPLLHAQRDVLKMHVIVLLLPFVSMLAWMAFGTSWDGIVIAVLLGVKALFDSFPPRVSGPNGAPTPAG